MICLTHRPSEAMGRNRRGLGRGGPAEGARTARQVGTGRKRRGNPPPSTQTGASSGSSDKTNKRAREDIDVRVAPSSPSAEKAVAGSERAPSGRMIAGEGSSPEPGAMVKTETRVGISCKEEPSEARGMLVRF